MNYKECRIIADELNTILKDGYIQKIQEGENGEFYFTVYTGESYTLLLCVNPPHPRLYITRSPFIKADARNFTMYLRKHVQGQKITGVSSMENERVIIFSLEKVSLVCELYPRGGNVYVLDKEDNVLYSLVPVEQEKYSRPSAVNPSPIPDITVPSGELYNEILDTRYHLLLQQDAFDKLKKRALKILKKEEERLLKKINAIQNDRDRAGGFTQYEKLGNLLKTYIYAVKKGMKEYSCTDYETGETVVIPLDPKLSPDENMAQFFKKAKRMKTGGLHIEKNLERAGEHLSAVQKYLNGIVSAESIPELRPVIENLSHDKFLRKLAGNLKPQSKSGEKIKSIPYRCFTTESGVNIYVGRNDEENDRLTFTFGKGRDIWMHVADYPGSHILVPMQSDTDELDFPDLRDAALITLHFSKAKGKDADVTYTRRKYVTKSKGMPKGMVNVSKHKTLSVKYDNERIRDIMEMNG